MFENTLSIALTFFLVANPIGNAPAIVTLIKDFPFDKQKKIVLREAFFALLLAIFFQYFGEVFLSALNIKDYGLTLTGGLLLFIVALKMIFPAGNGVDPASLKQEPFIVPIATPLVTGPGLLTIIMLYSKQESNDLKITTAILITWIGVTAVLVASPYLLKLLGKRGLTALEQLMGMILSMIAMNMFVKGSALFLKALSS